MHVFLVKSEVLTLYFKFENFYINTFKCRKSKINSKNTTLLCQWIFTQKFSKHYKLLVSKKENSDGNLFFNAFSLWKLIIAFHLIPL